MKKPRRSEPAGQYALTGPISVRVRADLQGLHACFCFGPGFENSVVDNGGRGSRLLVHDPALLRRRVADYVVFLVNGGRLRQRRGGGKSNERA